MLRRSHGALCYATSCRSLHPAAAAAGGPDTRDCSRGRLPRPRTPPAPARSPTHTWRTKAHPRASALSYATPFVPHIPVQAATPQRAGTADVRIVSPDVRPRNGFAIGTKIAHADSTVKTPLIPGPSASGVRTFDPVSVQGCVLLLSDGVRVALGGCGNPLMSAEPHGESIVWLVPWLRPFMLANPPSRPSGEGLNHYGSTVKIAPMSCSTSSTCGKSSIAITRSEPLC